MNVRQRILALRLLEKQKKNPEYAKKIGIEVKINKLFDIKENAND